MSTPVLSNLDFGGVARCINHPDPVNPQDVATKAYVDPAITEVEETGAGPFDDYIAGGARHIMCSHAAGVFTGVTLSGIAGDTLVITHQGSGYTELQHNNVSSINPQARFFNGVAGKHIRLFDNESALYQLLDVTTGSGTTLRLVLLSPAFPFANASDNAIGDTINHDGTKWSAGIAGLLRLVERAAGITLAAGQALFFAKNDTPNNPYFRDDTNTDRKILTAPAALTDLATIGVGTVLGNQVDAGASMAPKALTGAEQGENLRIDTRQTIASASGTIDVTLNNDTTVLVIQSIGDVSLRAMVGTAGGDGRLIQLEHERASGSGNLTVLHNTASAGFSPFFNPSSQPMVLGHATILQVRSRSGFWRPVNPGVRPFSPLGLLASEVAAGITLSAGQAQFYAKNDTPNSPYFRDDTNVDRKLLTAPAALTDLATISAGRVLGLQVNASGAAVPVALTGIEQGANLRLNTLVTDASTSGSASPYSVAAEVNWVRFSALTGTYTVNGCDNVESGKIIVWHVDPAVTGSLVLVHNNVALANNQRFYCPGGVDLTLRPGETAVTVQTVNRQRVMSVSRGPRVAVRTNSAGSAFERGRLNLIEGSGVSLTVADDAAGDEVDVTVAVPQALGITSAEVVRTGGSAAFIQALATTIPANTLQVGTMLAFDVHYTHVRVSATSGIQVSFGTDLTQIFAGLSSLPTGTVSGHLRGTVVCLALGSSQTIRLLLELYDDAGVRHATAVRNLDTAADMLMEARIQQTPAGPSDVLTMTQAYVLRLSKAEKI